MTNLPTSKILPGFLDWLESPAAIELANDIAYAFGEPGRQDPIRIDDVIGRAMLASYNLGWLNGRLAE